MDVRKTDVVIIGSGLAGLMTAYYLCEQKNVILITKSELDKSNSSLAQGGIAAAISKDDDWTNHFQDTIIAGGNHNVKAATELLVKNGAAQINKLIEIGVNFDKDDDNQFSLGMEGAHSIRRILHAGGDSTGKALVEAVMKKVLSKINIFEKTMAFDFLVESGVCKGVYTKDDNDNLRFFEADHIIIATGGVGQLYSVTSNCEEATGDGIAMALRAGAAVCDMEFIQFHPTLMIDKDRSLGLISEAVRGEGAKLVKEDGSYLMRGKHPLEDLAPRDIVAREIFKVKQENGKLFLDITKVENFKERFPSIYKMCIKAGVLEKGLISVAPGAHFIMGGIKVNRCGETTVKNLYAVGECANTGVHGANRLASNSLLEAVVYAEQLAKTVLIRKKELSENITHLISLKNFDTVDLPTAQEIKLVMDRFVGIVRSENELQKAINWFNQFQNILTEHNHLHLSIEQKTICNMLAVGLIIANASFLRTESRGGHFRVDYPLNNDGDWLGKRISSINGEMFREELSETTNSVTQLSANAKKELSVI